MPPSWFGSSESTTFARELAQFVLQELTGATGKRDAKFKAKAEKVMAAAARRMQEYKKTRSPGLFARSRMGNAFLWALRDGGCPPDYADELTEWFTMRL